MEFKDQSDLGLNLYSTGQTLHIGSSQICGHYILPMHTLISILQVPLFLSPLLAVRLPLQYPIQISPHVTSSRASHSGTARFSQGTMENSVTRVRASEGH
jgi:hypothetical protein